MLIVLSTFSKGWESDLLNWAVKFPTKPWIVHLWGCKGGGCFVILCKLWKLGIWRHICIWFFEEKTLWISHKIWRFWFSLILKDSGYIYIYTHHIVPRQWRQWCSLLDVAGMKGWWRHGHEKPIYNVICTIPQSENQFDSWYVHHSQENGRFMIVISTLFFFFFFCFHIFL